MEKWLKFIAFIAYSKSYSFPLHTEKQQKFGTYLCKTLYLKVLRIFYEKIIPAIGTYPTPCWYTVGIRTTGWGCIIMAAGKDLTKKSTTDIRTTLGEGGGRSGANMTRTVIKTAFNKCHTVILTMKY